MGWKLPEACLDAHQGPFRRLPVKPIQVLHVGAEDKRPECELLGAPGRGCWALGPGGHRKRNTVDPAPAWGLGRGTPGGAEALRTIDPQKQLIIWVKRE